MRKYFMQNDNFIRQVATAMFSVFWQKVANLTYKFWYVVKLP